MQHNPAITKWMEKQDPVIESMSQLEEYFERRVLDLAAATGRSYIVWQEILDNAVKVRLAVDLPLATSVPCEFN